MMNPRQKYLKKVALLIISGNGPASRHKNHVYVINS
jgi:hypothetical protein